MLVRNRRLLAPLGIICITVSVFIDKVAPEATPWADFFTGLLMGLAFAFGVASLIATIVSPDHA